MTVIHKYGCFLFLIAMLGSCKEKFDDNLPFSEANALVIEGEINDAPGPYLIQLTRSVNFDSNKKIMVSKAEVYVTDDLNNVYIFKEKGAGMYYSDSASLRGKTGGTYTLFINTDDNLNYKSKPCTIGKPARLDSVYFSNRSEYGFQVNGNIAFGPDYNMMTKIDASIAIGYSIDIKSTTSSSCTYIMHEITTKYPNTSSLGYMPVLKANTDYINGSRIKNIPFFYFNRPIPKRYPAGNRLDASYYSGSRFILVINLCTLSSETFSYYNDLINQVSGKNTFFEPTPVQLLGNIECINNRSKLAYGFFQANAVVKKYFRYYEWNNQLKELNKIPDIDIENIDTAICDGTISVTHI